MRNRPEKLIVTLCSVSRLAAASLLLVLIGCSSGDSGGNDAGPNQINMSEVDTGSYALLVDQPELVWTDCVNHRALECASLLVPLDYSNPDGEAISIAMARKQAVQATSSRTLILNPGGPGGVGIDWLDSFVRNGVISNSMKDVFNFVSFDPRGIGASNPIVCDTADSFAQNPYPDTRVDVEFNFNLASRFAQSCFESHGDYTQHLGSYNVVRDINEMRKALALSEIDFLGFSFGTRLAALYMQTYPQNTGRFVLDGSMTPEPEVAPLFAGSLLPGQANIDRLASACIGIPVVCSPEKFATDLQRRVNELAAGVASQESSLLFLILGHAATTPGFEQIMIGQLSRYLETREVEQLVQLDRLFGLSEQAEDITRINTTASIAVYCADDPTRPTVDSLDTLRIQFNAVSDLLAETQLIAAGMCAGWPESIDPIPQIATNQAPVSLVIGGPSDAQTPLVFAQQMAAAVGGQFLRSEHDGHTTVFRPGNSCTNTVVEAFFLTGNLPTISVCEADVIANTSALDWRDGMPGL